MRVPIDVIRAGKCADHQTGPAAGARAAVDEAAAAAKGAAAAVVRWAEVMEASAARAGGRAQQASLPPPLPPPCMRLRALLLLATGTRTLLAFAGDPLHNPVPLERWRKPEAITLPAACRGGGVVPWWQLAKLDSALVEGSAGLLLDISACGTHTARHLLGAGAASSEEG